MSYTISVIAVPDGNYYIRVQEEETGELKPQAGPYTREQVFHDLRSLGMEDGPTDALIVASDREHTAVVHGIIPKKAR